MTDQEKMRLLEETFELEKGALNGDTSLDTVSEYDSMAKLSLIVLFDEEFSMKLSGEKIREFKKVKDILDLMK